MSAHDPAVPTSGQQRDPRRLLAEQAIAYDGPTARRTHCPAQEGEAGWSPGEGARGPAGQPAPGAPVTREKPNTTTTASSRARARPPSPTANRAAAPATRASAPARRPPASPTTRKPRSPTPPPSAASPSPASSPPPA
ncbi:hypothetical protein NKH18_07240 [Streptomyces sp. M10(2022)]